MKRIFTVVLVIMIAISLTSCVNNGDNRNINDPNNELEVLTAKIMNITGNSILLANMSENANNADIYWFNTNGISIYGTKGEKLNYNVLQGGMVVDVEFDGIVQDSFPMGLGEVNSVRIIEQKDDLVNFYLGVIDDLYNTDKGLNDGISVIAFDLTEIKNLSETEKTALVYIASNIYDVETMSGTFEELSEQGYIDKENLYFENGLLFTLKDEEVSGNQFKFDVQKWRSGLGAYYFTDCIAEKKDDKWTYEIGTHMIS